METATDQVMLPDGTRLRVLRVGAGLPGRPVVLVHGLASNARLWDGVASRLASAGHPSIAIDLRGHGLSDAPSDGHSTLGAAQDIRDVIHAERLDRPLVVGQSWGGNIVVEMAADAQGVAGVVAVDGGAIDLPDAFGGDWDACRAALTPPTLAGTPRATIESMLRRGHPDFEDWAIEAQLANFAVADDGTVRAHLALEHHLAIVRSLWDRPASQALGEVAVPTSLLLVRGDGGRAAPTGGWLDEVVSANDLLSLTWVDDRVHDVHAQDPGLVAAHVLVMLREVA